MRAATGAGSNTIPAATRPTSPRVKNLSAASGPSITRNWDANKLNVATSDILPAIQTGMINVVPSTPYFALASQIYTSAPNMLEINWAPIVGALVVTRKAWDEMTPAVQAAVRAASDKAGVQIRFKARQEVDEAVAAMQKRGLVVNRPTPDQMREWNDLAGKLYPRIRGSMVPAETFDEVFSLLKTYRAGKAN